MRAIQWQRCLQEQRERYGKMVFSVAELCNLSGSKPRTVNVQLSRLLKAGVVERCANGKYAMPGAADAESLVSHLDSGAYITGLYAMMRHNLVTQAVTEIMCFTNRRHNLSRMRRTTVGTFRFVCVSPRIYAPPEGGTLASAEQAICDWVLMLKRAGLDAKGQATLRVEGKVDRKKLEEEVLGRYPKTVRDEVMELLERGRGS
jgi:hypothetical protein